MMVFTVKDRYLIKRYVRDSKSYADTHFCKMFC